MPDHSPRDRSEIILEEVRSQYRVIGEGLDNLQELPEKVEKVREDVAQIKDDVSVIKRVVRDHSGQITALERNSHTH